MAFEQPGQEQREELAEEFARAAERAEPDEPGDEVVAVRAERGHVVGVTLRRSTDADVPDVRRLFDGCAAAGLEGRRTAHSGRVGLAVELTARGASTRAVQFTGGWKGPAMVLQYTTSVTARDKDVSRYLREDGATPRKGATGRPRSPRR